MGKIYFGPSEGINNPSGPEEQIDADIPMETAIVQPEPIVSVIEVIREVPVEVIRTVETIVERLVEVPVEVVKEVEVIKEIIKEVIVDRIVEVEKVVKIPYVDIRYKAPKWAPLVLIAGVLEVSTFLIWLVLK